MAWKEFRDRLNDNRICFEILGFILIPSLGLWILYNQSRLVELQTEFTRIQTDLARVAISPHFSLDDRFFQRANPSLLLRVEGKPVDKLEAELVHFLEFRMNSGQIVHIKIKGMCARLPAALADSRGYAFPHSAYLSLNYPVSGAEEYWSRQITLLYLKLSYRNVAGEHRTEYYSANPMGGKLTPLDEELSFEAEFDATRFCVEWSDALQTRNVKLSSGATALIGFLKEFEAAQSRLAEQAKERQLR